MNLRWISRDGKMVLQQGKFWFWTVKGNDSALTWVDVPVHEEPKAEPELGYVVDNDPRLGFRLIDERLVDKLIFALEAIEHWSPELLKPNEYCVETAKKAIEEYRKFVPVKKWV